MRLAVIGASGWIGGLVAAEAHARGHEVTALVRDPVRGAAVAPGARTVVAALGDTQAVADALSGQDAVCSAYRAPHEAPSEMLPAARSLLEGARTAGVRRFLWVGSTAALQVPGAGGDVVDLPGFPEDWRASGLVHRETLNLFRAEGEDLDWTYACPPTSIAPGERTGSYRIRPDELLLDDEGQSRISAEDFAAAVVDVLEAGTHVRERIAIAY